ncbi:hypothetical protein B0H65DRAFT_218819 [Neurospora tetraspora]|uniref:Uncharacterized protein n=1 Tax=Neurospora tetraspora TaxID=94610 RepID=A0AAE0JC14_9PEZI|nr:hypothetical protein B0H65DRAFT_218819 [Neurospora tetraspora]
MDVPFDVPFDVWLSRVRMKEKAHTRPARSTHSSSSSSPASRTPSTSSSDTIRTPTSDSESTAPSSLHTFITSMPRPKMERLLESSASGSVGDFYQDRDDNPTAKSTYLVLHQPTNLALTLVGGKLTLHKVPAVVGEDHPLAGKCSWHWQCVETDGWLGFRNAASGRYLGLDGGKKDPDSEQPSGIYRVVSIKHGASERLVCVRAGDGEHEEGCTTPQQKKRGYILRSLFTAASSATASEISRLVKAWVKPQGSGSDSEEGWKEGSEVSMVWQDGQEGTIWRFVKV